MLNREKMDELEAGIAAQSAAQAQHGFPPENMVELTNSIIEPEYGKEFSEIRRDMVLSNLTPSEKELLLHVGSELRCLEAIEKEVNCDLQNLKSYFRSFLMYIVETSRAVDAKTLDAIRSTTMRQEFSAKRDSDPTKKKFPL